MTGMQGMLFPPLDEKSVHNGEGGKDEVLSQELQDRFATVRSLLREKSVENNNNNTLCDDCDANAAGSSAAGELKRKQQEAALETAKAVHDEMARLQNGIAELEAMYAAKQHREHILAGDDEDGGDDDLLESDVDEDDDGVILGEGNQPNDQAPPGVVFPALLSSANAIEPDVEIEEFSKTSSKFSDNRSHHHKRKEELVVTSEHLVCQS